MMCICLYVFHACHMHMIGAMSSTLSVSFPGTVSPENLISYAHKISLASSIVSPVGWQPSELVHSLGGVHAVMGAGSWLSEMQQMQMMHIM